MDALPPVAISAASAARHTLTPPTARPGERGGEKERTMAWNPSPEVAVARDAAAKLGNADQVMIVTINYANNQIGVTTYGKTKALCSSAKKLGDAAYKAVYQAMERGEFEPT